MKSPINFKIEILGTLLLKETPVKDLFAYKRILIKNDKETKEQGLVFKKDVGILTTLETCKVNDDQWCIVSQKFLDELTSYGWNGKDNNYKHWELISKKPYDDLNKVKYHLIQADISSHMIFDVNHEPLPVAIYFSYTDGSIKSSSYNLDTLAKILSKRNDVKLLVDNELIPYYNNDSGSERYSEFIWRPTVKEYRKMWKKCLSYKTEYPSTNNHMAVFDLDLLGLRRGGAAKFDSFYGEYE